MRGALKKNIRINAISVFDSHLMRIQLALMLRSQEHLRCSCICVFGVSILSISTIFLLDCGTVWTVQYFLFTFYY
jgi:hypothetical protein